MLAFKAVHKDMSSNFGEKPTYEIGKTYHFPTAARGLSGFHAAEDPIFCLGFIPPEQGRYFKVEIQGRTDPDGGAGANGQGAVAGTSITFLQELTVEQMLWYSMRYRLAWAKNPVHENTSGERAMGVCSRKGQSITVHGNRCVAVAGKEGCSATAHGSNALAVAEAPGATASVSGSNALGVAYGRDAKAEGHNGAWILIIDPAAAPEKQLRWQH